MDRLRLRILNTAFFLVLAACAAAPPPPLQPGTCYQTAHGQKEMNACARRDAKKADAELKAAYDGLMKRSPTEEQANLRAAEEAWTVYRHKQCGFEAAGVPNVAIHTMTLSECYARMTWEQAKNLRHQLDCENGSSACEGK